MLYQTHKKRAMQLTARGYEALGITRVPLYDLPAYEDEMVQHNHREYVEGCFRCELSRDEVDDGTTARVMIACDQCDVIMTMGIAVADDVIEDFTTMSHHKEFECQARA